MGWRGSVIIIGWLFCMVWSAGAQQFDREGWRTLTKDLDYRETPVEWEESEGQPQDQPIQQAPSGGGLSIPGQTIGIILLILAVIVLVALLLRQQGWWGRTKRKRVAVSIEQAEQHLPSAELDPLLQAALAAGDYRSALRIQFLRIVQHFDRTQIIRWRPDGTNRQYAREVQQEEQRLLFRQLIRWYESVWYGQAPLSLDQYEALQPLIQQLLPSSTPNQQAHG